MEAVQEAAVEAGSTDHPIVVSNPTPPPSVRCTSPSPSTSPTPAIGACPPLERSVSTASSVSSRSSFSRSAGDVAHRKRGFVRPHGTEFSKSAQARDSVQRLGSIAHLQYYFARTGLLDGKGAQMSKTLKKQTSMSTISRADTSELLLSPLSIPDRAASFSSDIPPFDLPSSTLQETESYSGGVLVDSPIDEVDEFPAEVGLEHLMLPPTVSTYQHKVIEAPPPPDVHSLRDDVTTGLENARKALESMDLDEEGTGQSWREIQGVHLIDVFTQALRSAKLYYTAHEQPARLWEIRTEKQLRQELIDVMSKLKNLAERNFAGGVSADEKKALLAWLDSSQELLVEEAQREAAAAEERKKWQWMNGDWSGAERETERELLFLRCFDANPESIPPWEPLREDTPLPTPFLEEMRTGLHLVELHNSIVKASRRTFGQIPVYHTDTQKPYRAAENLRYWIKAAELRWEVLLTVDVMGVVHGADDAAWRGFDMAIRTWCRKLREEMAQEAEPAQVRRAWTMP